MIKELWKNLCERQHLKSKRKKLENIKGQDEIWSIYLNEMVDTILEKEIHLVEEKDVGER